MFWIFNNGNIYCIPITAIFPVPANVMHHWIVYRRAAISFLAISFKSFLSILPLAFFSIESTKRIPPANCLYPANLSFIYACTPFSLSWLPDLITMYARGTSLPSSPDFALAPPADTPITAASLIFG